MNNVIITRFRSVSNEQYSKTNNNTTSSSKFAASCRTVIYFFAWFGFIFVSSGLNIFSLHWQRSWNSELSGWFTAEARTACFTPWGSCWGQDTGAGTGEKAFRGFIIPSASEASFLIVQFTKYPSLVKKKSAIPSFLLRWVVKMPQLGSGANNVAFKHLTLCGSNLSVCNKKFPILFNLASLVASAGL